MGVLLKLSVSYPVRRTMVSGKVKNAAPGVAAKVQRGTTLSRRVPKSIESWFHTKPVSRRSSIVNTAFARPGIESFLANEKVDNLATDDLVVVVVDVSQPVSATRPNAINM